MVVYKYKINECDELTTVVFEVGRSLFSLLRRNGLLCDLEVPFEWFRVN